jgi:CBS domain-containing protein
MLARDVMTTPVIAVARDAAVPDIAEVLLAGRISAVPVVEDDGRVCGIVSEGDLINRADAGTRHRRAWWLEMLKGNDERAQAFTKAHGTRAEDVMSAEVVSVGEDTPLPEIAATLEKHHVKRVPVLREGRLVGIVSRANLLHGLASSAPSWAPQPGDRAVRAELQRKLDEAGLPMHQINVMVRGGTVQLWGWIDSDAQRRAARVAVESTQGADSLEDNLVITTPAERAGRGYV